MKKTETYYVFIAYLLKHPNDYGSIEKTMNAYNLHSRRHSKTLTKVKMLIRKRKGTRFGVNYSCIYLSDLNDIIKFSSEETEISKRQLAVHGKAYTRYWAKVSKYGFGSIPWLASNLSNNFPPIMIKVSSEDEAKLAFELTEF